MRICAYLNFKGNAREAMTFYAEVFRAKPDFMTYAEMPPTPEFPVGDEIKDKILHGELGIDKEQSLMFSDDTRPGEGIPACAASLTLMLDDEREQRRIFAALGQGGKVLMPLGKTFWSAVFGTVVDRFGVTWHLNLCRLPEGASG